VAPGDEQNKAAECGAEAMCSGHKPETGNAEPHGSCSGCEGAIHFTNGKAGKPLPAAPVSSVALAPDSGVADCGAKSTTRGNFPTFVRRFFEEKFEQDPGFPKN
jgi:hypothetical protein